MTQNHKELPHGVLTFGGNLPVFLTTKPMKAKLSIFKKCHQRNTIPSNWIGSIVLSMMVTSFSSYGQTTRSWDGGAAGTGTDLGTATNWSGDVLPANATGDIAQWNGTVAGNLVLTYSTGLAGGAGNPGINFAMSSAQTGNVSIDSGLSTTAIRLNGINISAGAGAFTLGNGANAFNFTLGGTAGTRTWTNDSSNTATISSEVAFNAGGAGAQVLAIGGSGNWLIAAPLILGNNTGANSVTLNKSGTGTLTLTASNVNSCNGPVTVNGGTIVAGVTGGNPQYGAFEKTSLLTINSGSTVRAMGANAFGGWSGGSLAVTINGGQLMLEDGIAVAGNHSLAALTLNGGSIVGNGNAIYGGFNLGANVSVTNDSTISATNTNTAGVSRTINVTSGKTLTWSGTIHNGNNNAWTTSLTFAGEGTTILSGNNTHSGTTTVSGGSLRVGDGGTTGNAGTGPIVNNASLVFNRSDNFTVSQLISGTGSFQKLGAGTLTLTSSSTYSGTTTVSNGKLALGTSAGSLDSTTALTIAPGASFSAISSSANRVQTLASLNMDGGTIEFGLLAASADRISVTGSATLAGTNTVKISGSVSPGTYTLISSSSPLTGTINLDSSAMPTGFLSYSGAINGNNYELTVTGNPTPATAYWKGDVSAIWSDATGAPDSNWTSDAEGTTDASQVPGATTDVVFAATGSANGATTLGANTTIDSLTFGTGTYAVGGDNSLTILGTNANGIALEVLGGSSTTLSTSSSTWTGVTRVNSTGTLTVSSSGACGDSTAALELEGNLKLNTNLTKGDLSGVGVVSADTASNFGVQSVNGSSFAGTFEDGLAPLSFTKSGAGTLTLLNQMTNTGTTTVSAGRLEIGDGNTSGALGTGDITVNAGGSLSWNRSDDITIGNNIYGAVANIIKDGSGTLTVTGNNNFATAGGSGFLINSGKVVLGSATAVPNNIVFGVRGGKLDLNQNSIICGWLDGFAPGEVTDDTVTAGTTTLTLNVGGNPVYSGAINNGANGRVLSLVKTGGGTQTLSGTSNYSGGTSVQGGLLQVNSSNALGSGSIVLPGNNVDITRLQLGNGVTISNNLEIGIPTRTNFNGALSMAGANDSATVDGSILVKASGLVGGTLNGGAIYGPTGTGLLTIAGAVNSDSPTTQVLMRGGNVRFNNAGSATNWRNEGNMSLGAENALNPASVLIMSGSNAAALDLNGFHQTLVGVGSSTAHNFAATVTNTSGTQAILTLATDPSIDYGTFSGAVPMGSLGTNILDGNTVIAGNLSVVKQGLGTAQLQGPSSFAGNLTVSAGTLIADRNNNVNTPATSSLGNPQTDRSITVENGATLKLNQGDVFGSATTIVVATLVVNSGGTVVNNGNNFNTLGPVVLNGGTIATTGGAIAGYQSYNLLGTVSVTGTTPSAITVSGPGNAFNGVHLDTFTIFDVADATNDASADLVVSAPLIDRNATLGGAGGVAKSGPGTMAITVAAAYTGATSVQAGVLSINNPYIASGSDVILSESGKIDLAFVGTDTIRSLYIGGVLQYTGVWGGIGSGAQYETSAITGTGTLTVTTGATPPGYTAWATDHGLTAGVNDGADQDPDNDGIKNLLEYVFGGDPLSSSQTPVPTSSMNETHMILTFKRSDLSETDTTTIVQWSTDLGSTWTDFATVGAVSSGAVTVVENDASDDDVSVAIPRSNAVNGKLFGRVKVTK